MTLILAVTFSVLVCGLVLAYANYDMGYERSSRLIVAFTVLATFAGLCLSIYLPSVQYGTGWREGTVQKLSHKGIIWRTHEGTLVGNLDQTSSTFDFSVDNPAVLEAIQQLPRQAKVRLRYVEYLGNYPWRGSSSYLVTGVELIKEYPCRPSK